MARCGCAGTTCNCVVTAGVGTTVTGAGTPANPYVVSADSFALGVIDTPTIDLTLTGTGTPGDPYEISGSVICAGIATQCGLAPVDVADTDSVDLTASGGNPNVITADVKPDNARAITITGSGVGVCLSTDPGNEIIFGTDGCLFAPAGGASPFQTCDDVNACITVTDSNTVDLTKNLGDITASVKLDPAASNIITATANGLLASITVGACGLTGAGTIASPLMPKINGTWPFACDLEDNATGLVCGNDGNLYTACPPTKVYNFVGGPVNNTVNIPLTTSFQVLDTASVPVQDPSVDPCASGAMNGAFEVDVDFDISANTSVELMFAGDAYFRYTNSGGTPANVTDQHWQLNRPISNVLGPGVLSANSGTIQARFTGAGPADVNRVQWRGVATLVTGCN